VIAARVSAIRRANLMASFSKKVEMYAVRHADEEVSVTETSFSGSENLVRAF
jgi:hypothetical protein